jgi:hypothetical protein
MANGLYFSPLMVTRLSHSRLSRLSVERIEVQDAQRSTQDAQSAFNSLLEQKPAAMQLTGTAGTMPLPNAARAAVHTMGGLAVADYMTVLRTA